jgi:hypothetical protein
MLRNSVSFAALCIISIPGTIMVGESRAAVVAVIPDVCDGCDRCASCDNCSSCGKKPCGCTCKKKKELRAKAASAYKGVFYDNDFSYLNDPCYCGHLCGENLKQLTPNCLGRCSTVDVGGQWRLRYHHERGMKGPQRFLPLDDDFLLNRLRLYTNWQVNNYLRFYVEGIYADSYGEGLPERIIDVNNGDFLNYFADIKPNDSLTFRIGRQELLYGAQRTISPLDWANTRRTFEGIRLLYKQGDWAIDGFFTHLVLPRPDEFDEADYNLPVYGMYGTYSGYENNTIDFYYIGFDDADIGRSLHTFGSRINGKRDDWLWEVEGAYQVGARTSGVSQEDGFITAGLGRAFPSACWKPTVWVYYDQASPHFDQLFPLAHKYLGFIDAIQRHNIQSPNVLITAKPHEKLTLLLWYYYFRSDSSAPILSIGGTPVQNTGRDVGNELDLIANIQLTPRSELLFGWSHFWKGSKIVNPSDADFFYTQWLLNF